MAKRQNDIREAGLKSRSAMTWLRDNHLPAEPVCYTVAYEYLFTDNQKLKASVDACDLNKEDYHEQLEPIYRNNIINRHYTDLSMSGDNANKYVSEILSLLVDSQIKLKKVDPELAAKCQKAIDDTLKETATQLNAIEDEYLTEKENASRDGLTNALDQQGLMTTLKELLQHSENIPMALLIINIDKFKVFNDANGKLMGDAVLKNIAKSITNLIKGSDIVSRLPGDEFCIALPKTTAQEGVHVAEKIRKKVDSISLKKKGAMTPVKVTVSIGVSAYTGKGAISTIFENAKKAMFRSKDMGRNTVNCDT